MNHDGIYLKDWYLSRKDLTHTLIQLPIKFYDITIKSDVTSATEIGPLMNKEKTNEFRDLI